MLLIPKISLIFQWVPRHDPVDSLLKEKFKILGFTMNRQGKTHECLEERMQSANKAWWRDGKIYRSKDVPWRVKCGWWNMSTASFFFWEVKIVLVPEIPRQSQRIGIKGDVSLISFQKTRK